MPLDGDDEHDPALPIDLDPVSNGEYAPYRTTPLLAETVRRVRESVDQISRRRAVSRRQFLQTTAGAATVLFTLAACSKDQSKSESGREPGGTFDVPRSSTTDPEIAGEALGGDEFVLDVQTHLLDMDLGDSDSPGGAFAQGYPYSSCGEDDWRACYGHNHWLDEIFVRSDTSMAVISAVPILAEPNPLSIAVMEEAKTAARHLCGDGRVLLHGQVNPNVGDLAVSLDGMTQLRDEHPIAAWKVYTHIPSSLGWWLDDHDPDAVKCGEAFLQQVRDIGPRIVCVHKGFGGGSEYSSPIDIGPVAKANPDITFVVYHSGYDGPGEGPYSEATAGVGVNRFLASLEANGIGPGGNVYAELGSTWWNAMRNPTEAAHVIGKLLAALGPDHILWGTDSIWYGSPQSQIQAFRTFRISDEFQDQYGYPPLTDATRRKIFGQNAARLYGVDAQQKCDPTSADVEALRASLPVSRPYGPRTVAEVRALVQAHGGLV